MNISASDLSVGTVLYDPSPAASYLGTVTSILPGRVLCVRVAWHKWTYTDVPADRDMINLEFDFDQLSIVPAERLSAEQRHWRDSAVEHERKLQSQGH